MRRFFALGAVLCAVAVWLALGATVRNSLLAYAPGGVHPALGFDAEATVGARYRFQLGTHCDRTYARFDGRWWEAATAGLGSGRGADASGTMTLIRVDLARFRGDEGEFVELSPVPASRLVGGVPARVDTPGALTPDVCK